jgi:hypothetical protein
MATGLVWDERFAWHDAGLASTNLWAEPYPALDRPEAKRRLWGLLQASGLADRLVPVRARPATDDELLRFHTAGYVDRILRDALVELVGCESACNTDPLRGGFRVEI